jgi:hypothetical protein
MGHRLELLDVPVIDVNVASASGCRLKLSSAWLLSTRAGPPRQN